MPKFMCFDTSEKEIGFVKAENEQQALDKARKLNPNAIMAKEIKGESVEAPAEAEAPKAKRRKGKGDGGEG